MEMADKYKEKADELIDAIKRETLDDFIGFNNNKELKNDNDELLKLIKMLQTIKEKWSRIILIYFKVLLFIDNC